MFSSFVNGQSSAHLSPLRPSSMPFTHPLGCCRNPLGCSFGYPHSSFLIPRPLPSSFNPTAETLSASLCRHSSVRVEIHPLKRALHQVIGNSFFHSAHKASPFSLEATRLLQFNVPLLAVVIVIILLAAFRIAATLQLCFSTPRRESSESESPHY